LRDAPFLICGIIILRTGHYSFLLLMAREVTLRGGFFNLQTLIFACEIRLKSCVKRALKHRKALIHKGFNSLDLRLICV